MERKVEVLDYENGSFNKINISIPLPSKCPVCGIAYGDEPLKVFRHEPAYYRYDVRNSVGIYFCPHCEYFFYVNYSIHNNGPILCSARIENMYPHAEYRTTFAEEIEELSPQFVNIYKQAETAEAQGLSDICGMGYRKALEFLVKDFACMMKPSDDEKIKGMPLSKCINEYVEAEAIRKLALASAWIGNDETHYVRKHEDYDIEDLKQFIKSMVSFIDMAFNVSKANELLRKKK